MTQKQRNNQAGRLRIVYVLAWEGSTFMSQVEHPHQIIWIKPLKDTNLGVAQALFEP